jgi:hypothetical protein
VLDDLEEINLDDITSPLAKQKTTKLAFEAENFAIYSNFEFLYLIGKYAA